jgi:two-component system OmpR family response regulator
MELRWKSKPIGKVPNNLSLFKKLTDGNFTQLNWHYPFRPSGQRVHGQHQLVLGGQFRYIHSLNNNFAPGGHPMRLLLIEDDQKIAAFIIKGFKAEGFAVDHAEDGLKGLDLGLTEPYDVIIVDLMLPKLDGLSVIENLRKQKVPVPVIILSAKDSVDDRVRGLQIGSDDYLPKPFAFAELLARVQALMRRRSGSTETTLFEVADLSLNLITREVSRAGRRIDLQPLEYSLLAYLMRNSGKVVSKTMIMEHVWDYHFDPQTNVVEARICRLRDKIDKGFDSKLIHTIRGVGYVLRPDQ